MRESQPIAAMSKRFAETGFPIRFSNSQRKVSRHSGTRPLARARNPYSLQGLWIAGSLASLAPRNDEWK
jgi:hypothetical protein